MSVFRLDPSDPGSPGDYLKEKALRALEAAVSFVDLANEPDTSSWYEKELQRPARWYAGRVLIRRAVLEAIVRGEVTLQFRRWQRATVRAGGELRTPLGVLAIDTVDVVAWREVDAAAARAAGYPSRAALKVDLDRREGAIHRIALHYLGDDPRVALRHVAELSASDVAALRATLAGFDASSRRGPWTETFLRLIASHPGERAVDIAASVGWKKPPFKSNVRRLKELGLTESLSPGYRLSPRGQALWDTMRC